MTNHLLEGTNMNNSNVVLAGASPVLFTGIPSVFSNEEFGSVRVIAKENGTAQTKVVLIDHSFLMSSILNYIFCIVRENFWNFCWKYVKIDISLQKRKEQDY